MKIRIYKRKLRLLAEEEKLLLELMKVLQRDTFEKNSMSMDEYLLAMTQYEKRLGETVEDKIRIETKLSNLMKIKGKKLALKEESKRITDLIKKLQDDYMNKGKIETRIYKNMSESYTKRLTDVEEELTFLDAQKVLKTGGFWRRLFSRKSKGKL